MNLHKFIIGLRRRLNGRFVKTLCHASLMFYFKDVTLKTFNYLGSLWTNQNSIHEEIKYRFKAGNSCYYSVQTLRISKLKYIKQ